MPTLEDYQLVFCSNTFYGTRVCPVGFSYDIDALLNTFFQQPPAWRLIHCAISAHETEVPESMQLSYYRRARKAVLRSMHESPTYKTVQTFYFLALFGTWKGQPEAGRPFLRYALDLIIKLRLDVDPDASPWLYHLNLTPREKEDRRRAFWSVFYHMRYQQAVSSNAVSANINSSNINPPSAIVDVYPVFEAVPQTFWICEIYDFISKIKQHHYNPPKSIDGILASETLDFLTPTDHHRFHSQLGPLVRRSKLDILSLTMFLFSATCILNRPRLFLSGLKSFNPIYLGKDSQYIIANAIQQCLDCAFRIVNLLPMLLEIIDYNAAIVYPVFESMIVFWYVWCRMDKMWWAVAPRRKPEWGVLHGFVEGVLRFVRKVHDHEGSTTGTTTPILKCMESMLQEMVNVASGSTRSNVGESPQSVESDDLAHVVLGMKIVSLDEGIGLETSRRDIHVTKEPHCYLGLLGMEVGGCVRWKGPTEESWRLFWKLYT
ncbi:UNVERIFIED_CONTAM: hypothetical protein HDU68_005949 [Siphonaria sp. JEL0065]|nr:hypothetical protein HDU68_005949 [Siphonaria sp. JEL0065]